MEQKKSIKVKNAIPTGKGRGKWFKKIPTDVFLSPAGIILVFFALLMEILDLIPAGSLTWEWIPELIFIAALVKVAKVPVKSCLLPFIIERIPAVSDIVPSFILRLFI